MLSIPQQDGVRNGCGAETLWGVCQRHRGILWFATVGRTCRQAVLVPALKYFAGFGGAKLQLIWGVSWPSKESKCGDFQSTLHTSPYGLPPGAVSPSLCKTVPAPRFSTSSSSSLVPLSKTPSANMASQMCTVLPQTEFDH